MKNLDKDKKRFNEYIKYSVMAWQMIAAIVVFTLLGFFLDSKFEPDKPYNTIVFSIFGVAAGLYLALKDFIKK
ncbi:MAG: AtpZ/AtpI family protein [Luteibaculaceae bacterium]